MPTEFHPTVDADALANTLYTSLTAGTGVTLPVVDLTSTAYAVPSSTNNSLYAVVPELTEASLTSREVNGTGMFDGLMASLGKHLQHEYEKGRISGKEYAEAWIASSQGALSSAVQYVLSKDQTQYQTKLVQLQARIAEIAAVSEKVNLEIAKTKLAAARLETDTLQANLALSKLKLATEDAQYHALKSQTATSDYQLANLLPKELEKAQKAIEAASAEISATVAKKDQILYETASILPTQKTGIEGDNAIKVYQLASVLTAQTANMTADTAGKVYSNQFLLPAQLETIREQTEANRAKTKDTRTDGSVIGGAIGKQNSLQQQQIDSYKRDSEAKVAKMLLDTWVTQKSLDEGLPAPASLTDVNINTVMTKVRANLGLS